MTAAIRCREFDSLVSAYVDHEAAPNDVAKVEQHVRTCPECARRLRRLQRLAHQLDADVRAMLTRGESDVRRIGHTFRPPPQLMFADGPPARLVSRLVTLTVLLLFGALIAVVLVRSAPEVKQTTETASQPTGPSSAAEPHNPVVFISVDGLVDPAVAAYVHRTVITAEQRHAAALIVSLDRAGLETSMQAVEQDLTRTAVPHLTSPGLEPSNLDSFLRSNDGRTVLTPNGPVVLQTAGAPIEFLPIDPLEALWHRLLDPTTAYLFFVLGLYAVFLEIAHPGAVVPGVTGLVCLALAIVAFTTLPTNWVGVVVLLSGVALMAVELKAAKHGVLVLVGATCLAIGSVLLYSTPGSLSPALMNVAVAPAVLVGVVSAGLILGLLVALLARRIRSLPSVITRENLIGAHGLTRTSLDPNGVVHVNGELWSAHARGVPLGPGERVRILARHGLVLEVESATNRGAATRKGAV